MNATEEYIGLDDNKYIGDLLAEFKSVKDRNKGEVMHCKLIFKKRLFRESDEAVTDPMFVQLSYVQVLFLFIFSLNSRKMHTSSFETLNFVYSLKMRYTMSIPVKRGRYK